MKLKEIIYLFQLFQFSIFLINVLFLKTILVLISSVSITHFSVLINLANFLFPHLQLFLSNF